MNLKPIGDKNILDKKIPKSARYKDVKPTLDTGFTVDKFLKQEGGEPGLYARFRRQENFRRIKTAELAKFVMIQRNSEEVETEEIPSILNSDRLLVKDNIVSEQELLIQKVKTRVNRVINNDVLVLDIREKEDYDQCHIDGALLYEAPKLTRSVNALTPEILAFKNVSGKLVVIYDYDEKLAVNTGNMFFEKGFDNICVLTGGLKIFAEKFPDLVNGVPPPTPQGSKTARRSKSASTRRSFQSSVDLSSPRSITSSSTRRTLTSTTATAKSSTSRSSRTSTTKTSTSSSHWR